MATKPRSKSLSQDDLQKWQERFRRLSNSARYDEAYALAKGLMARYPDVPLFAYYEAVMTAEDDVGYSPAEIHARYRAAAKKLRRLLRRTRAMTPHLRVRVRNEYYWFSRQPLKQYHLGQECVKAGDKNGYYPQGVGAAELAKRHALAGRRERSLTWARKSERAWLQFFKMRPDWFNAYFFYAAAVGLQGRREDREQALAKAAHYAGKPPGWRAIKVVRADIERACAALELT